MKRALLPLGALSLGACLNLNVPEPVDIPTDPATETFAASTGVNISKMTKTSDGVYYLDTQAGTGVQLTAPRVVSATFTGYLKDASLFVVQSQPQLMDLNVTIPGLVEGMIGMRIGGVRKIVVPSELGFGANGQPSIGIPANATLIYDMTLVDLP